MKKWAVLLLTTLLLSEPAWAACLGFSDEEMPKVVADYICKYDDVTAQPLAVSETPGGTIWFIRLSNSNGEHIADVHQIEDANGNLGRILYFVLPDGRVLLDRRANL